MTLWFYHIGLCCISKHFANPKLGGKNVKQHGLIHKKIEINWSIAKVAIFNPRLAQNPTMNCRYILGSGVFIHPCIINLFMVLDYRARQPFLMKMIAILAYHAYRLCPFSVNKTIHSLMISKPYLHRIWKYRRLIPFFSRG